MTRLHGLLLALIALGQFSPVTSRATVFPQSDNPQSVGQAQQRIADTALQFLQPVVRALRKELADDATLQAYLAQITISADPWTIEQGNAFAERQHGARVVVETTLLQWIWCLSEVDLMENGPWPYKQQASDWWARYGLESKAAMAMGLGLPSATLSLQDYVPDPLHREFIEEYSRLEEEPVIAWVVLHEIAHHVLGHVNRSPRNLQESRQWELDADNWAFQKLRDLKYPLLGVDKFFLQWARFQSVFVAMLDGQTEPASPARLAEVEQKSDHPLWRTRLLKLVQNFDVNAQPEAVLRFFTAMEIMTRPDGHKEMLKITVVFPSPVRASEWGRGLLIVRDKASIPVWVEYKDGQAYLYGGNGHIKLQLKTPAQLWSEINYEVVQKNGASQSVHLAGWYDSFASYFPDDIVEGITLLDGLELSSPAKGLIPILNQLPWDQTVKRSVIDTMTACTVKLNGILLPYYKGMMTLTEEERQTVWSRNMEQCQAALKATLGEERSKVLQAKTMESKTFQPAFVYFMKGQKD